MLRNLQTQVGCVI